MNTLICQGFTYDCSLGFHENEKGVKQKILVDVEVTLKASSRAQCETCHSEPEAKNLQKTGRSFTYAQDDRPDSIPFDYFKANQLIAEFLKDKHFNLIETLGQGIAELLLEKFKVPSVKVSVTKKPLDMPNVGCVKFVCTRSREACLAEKDTKQAS